MDWNSLSKEEQEKFAREYEVKLYRNTSHFSNLLMVAWADGELNEKEKTYLNHIYSKYGMDENTMLMVKNWKFDNTIPPVTFELKLEHLLELVLMAMVDGEVDDRELTICKKVAHKYGLISDVIDQMVEIIWKAVDGKIKVKPDYQSLLNYIKRKFRDKEKIRLSGSLFDGTLFSFRNRF